MESWLEIDKDVSELVANWRWEEPQQFNGRYETVYDDEIKNNDTYDPKYYNYSYSEWRKKRSYYHQEADEYYKDFIGTLMPLRHGDHPSLHPNQESQNKIYAAINKCVEIGNIPSTHLLIGTLYSSYHLVSPYMLPTFKYLLTKYKKEINFEVTSISNPRYTVGHIAAMSNDTELLDIFYDIGGNIDVIDGSNFSPLYIALGKRNFKVANKLLWMNAIVDEKKTIKKLSNYRLRHLMSVYGCLTHFIFSMDIHINSISKPLQQNNEMDINNDIIQSIITFTLPVQSYQTIKRLLNKLENNRIEGVMIEYDLVVEEGKNCLDALIDLKKELLSIDDDEYKDIDDDDDLYPFGNVSVSKMILCNLFAISMSNDDEYKNSLKWKTRIDNVLCKPKKKSMFYNDDTYIDQEIVSTSSSPETLNLLKWIFGGAIVVGAVAILVRQITNR